MGKTAVLKNPPERLHPRGWGKLCRTWHQDSLFKQGPPFKLRNDLAQVTAPAVAIVGGTELHRRYASLGSVDGGYEFQFKRCTPVQLVGGLVGFVFDKVLGAVYFTFHHSIGEPRVPGRTMYRTRTSVAGTGGI